MKRFLVKPYKKERNACYIMGNLCPRPCFEIKQCRNPHLKGSEGGTSTNSTTTPASEPAKPRVPYQKLHPSHARPPQSQSPPRRRRFYPPHQRSPRLPPCAVQTSPPSLPPARVARPQRWPSTSRTPSARDPGVRGRQTPAVSSCPGRRRRWRWHGHPRLGMVAAGTVGTAFVSVLFLSGGCREAM